MKIVMLAGAIALTISSAAFAQSSQGQAGAQAGTNGNASTAPDSTMQSGRMREGTIGMTGDTGRAGPNGAPTSTPRSEDSPTGRASEGQSAPK